MRSEQLVKQNAELVYIACSRHSLAGNLFGTCVLGGHQPSHRLGWGAVRIAIFIERLGDSKVEQLDYAIAIDEYVRRLDVPMHDKIAVRIPNRPRDYDE